MIRTVAVRCVKTNEHPESDARLLQNKWLLKKPLVMREPFFAYRI